MYLKRKKKKQRRINITNEARVLSPLTSYLICFGLLPRNENARAWRACTPHTRARTLSRNRRGEEGEEREREREREESTMKQAESAE